MENKKKSKIKIYNYLQKKKISTAKITEGAVESREFDSLTEDEKKKRPFVPSLFLHRVYATDRHVSVRLSE